MYSASSPGTLGKSPSCQFRLASSIRAFELETKFHQMCRWPSIGATEENNASVCSRGVGEYQPKATLGAASDGAVDDVAGSLAVSGRSSIQHIDARDIPKDAAP